MKVDVAVVGGGIAGASAAYEMAARSSVVLIEAEATCGYHSTGRSAAVFTECYGEPVVRRLAIGSRSFLETPPPDFGDTLILTQRPLLFVGRPDQADQLAEALTDFRAMVPSVRELTGEEAARWCPVLDPSRVEGGIMEPHSQDIDVHALHLGFQTGLRRRGGQILTGAPVTAIDGSSGGWRLTAAETEIEAAVIVDAAGAWSDAVAALAGAAPLGLIPLRRTAFTFDPGRPHRNWPMVIDIDETWYFKPEGPHLLGSPADETPSEPCDARPDELDVAIGIDRIQQMTTLDIRSVAHTWAGLRTFVTDRRPVNGWDPLVPGFYWLAGQGGFGIKTSPAMAQVAAAAVAGDPMPAALDDIGLTFTDLAPQRLG